MSREEFPLDTLTPAVEEVDQAVVTLMQHAANAILEAHDETWLDDALFAVATGAIRGVLRMVGMMPPDTRAVFWQALSEAAGELRTMQAQIFRDRLDGKLGRVPTPPRQ
jgi:hypothetical protein